jgi:hypothetical protein
MQSSSCDKNSRVVFAGNVPLQLLEDGLHPIGGSETLCCSWDDVTYEYTTVLPTWLETPDLWVLLTTFQDSRIGSHGNQYSQLHVGFTHFDQVIRHCRKPISIAVGIRACFRRALIGYLRWHGWKACHTHLQAPRSIPSQTLEER